MIPRYTNVERALQAHTKRCNYLPPPRRGHTMTDRELVIEFMMLYAANAEKIVHYKECKYNSEREDGEPND